MENHGRTRQATDDSIIKHRKDVICMPVTKARIQTHTQNMWYLFLFHGSTG